MFCLTKQVTQMTKGMSKNKTKKENYVFNQQVLSTLVEKYGLTVYYIRQCINGNRVGIMPDKIRKDYKELCAKVEAVLKS